jgi:hypothetical protein
MIAQKAGKERADTGEMDGVGERKRNWLTLEESGQPVVTGKWSVLILVSLINSRHISEPHGYSLTVQWTRVDALKGIVQRKLTGVETRLKL